MAPEKNIHFVDNDAALKRGDFYMSVTVNAIKILESWRESLFSFEWLLPDGSIRSIGALPEREQPKRELVENNIGAGLPVEKPILGIGIQDNIEIGSGRAEFLTAAALGLNDIPVHIPRSCEKDFKPYLSELSSKV